MVYTIPNSATASFAAQSEIFQTDIDIITAGHAFTGVLSGCGVTTTGAANNGVTVAAGVVALRSVPIAVAGGTVTLTAPDATNPRIDLVWADSTGAIGKTNGTAAAAAAPPALPANTIALAMVYSPNAGGNTVGSTWITDKGVPVVLPFVTLAADILWTGGSPAANVLADVLTFPVLSGKAYHFKFVGNYVVTASTSGSRWTVNVSGGTPTFLSYRGEWALTATTSNLTATPGALNTTVQLPAAASATSNVSNGGANLILIEGIIQPSANGTFAIQGAREVTTDTLTLKAGAMLEMEQLT